LLILTLTSVSTRRQRAGRTISTSTRWQGLLPSRLLFVLDFMTSLLRRSDTLALPSPMSTVTVSNAQSVMRCADRSSRARFRTLMVRAVMSAPVSMSFSTAVIVAMP